MAEATLAIIQPSSRPTARGGITPIRSGTVSVGYWVRLFGSGVEIRAISTEEAAHLAESRKRIVTDGGRHSSVSVFLLE